MLCPAYYQPRLNEVDQWVFKTFVPPEHFVRRAFREIPWNEFYGVLSSYFEENRGRPADSPVLMLKLEYLRYHDNLSDRQVIERAKTDMAYRYFLQLGQQDRPPHASMLSYFRGRLGRDGFREVFQRLVGIAREKGLVKDRLRVKDASHVIANIAVPTTLGLVAQSRDKLLAAAEPFDPVRVEGERVNIELLRESSAGQNDEQRLVARVTHLREILAWVDSLQPPPDAADNHDWQKLLQRRTLAHKVLADQEHPEAGRRTLSTVDSEARRGRHGEWYDGYVVDLLEDADSELITELDVLEAGGDEAVDAVELVRREEEAHGNHIEAISIDGAGFNGPMLRALEDPDGLNVETFVPPKKEPATERFTPDDFEQDAKRETVTCPAGSTSKYRQRDSSDRGWMYRFARADCEDCPLLSRCMARSPRGPFGRTVTKSDYEQEYRRARQKSLTEKYENVRREHPKVERKLGEMLNRHGGRHARYWGKNKILIQPLMAAFATNVKRMVRSLCAPNCAPMHQD